MEEIVGRRTASDGVGAPDTVAQPDWQAFGQSGAYMYFDANPEAKTNLYPCTYALHEETVC